MLEKTEYTAHLVDPVSDLIVPIVAKQGTYKRIKTNNAYAEMGVNN